MFKRILVPVDGSPRAERALPVAARLARAAGGTVVLLEAIGIPHDYGSYMYGPFLAELSAPGEGVLEAKEDSARAYIEAIRRSEKLAGVKVETRVAVGAASVAIQDIAHEEHIDLIVLCSRGDTGFKRWVLGSVAQSVSRACRVPVLVLREDGTAPDSAFPDRLRPLRSIVALVALDGSSFAEAAIIPTAILVSALAVPAQGTLLLTRVVPSAAPGNAPAAKQLALDEAKVYLRQVSRTYADEAAKYAIKLNTAVTSGKDVAQTLIGAAEYGEEIEGSLLKGNCHMIAITTHGRSGLQRMALGSVTEHILGSTKLPLLVVHPPTDQ